MLTTKPLKCISCSLERRSGFIWRSRWCLLAVLLMSGNIFVPVCGVGYHDREDNSEHVWWLVHEFHWRPRYALTLVLSLINGISMQTRRATFGVKVRVCNLIPAYSDVWGNAFRILMLWMILFGRCLILWLIRASLHKHRNIVSASGISAAPFMPRQK